MPYPRTIFREDSQTIRGDSFLGEIDILLIHLLSSSYDAKSIQLTKQPVETLSFIGRFSNKLGQ